MGGDVDGRGEELPSLTKRSSNVKLSKIIEYHQPDFTDRREANPLFWKMVRGMIEAGVNHQFKSVIHDSDPFFERETPGVLAVSWHIAGLVDPMLIVKHLDKPYVFAGRHDILTGPIIGFWGRRLGVQPLLRQAEIQRGHVDSQTAKSVNNNSLLTVTAKLAHGQASLLLPEGHSHQNSHLLRLRTGSMRTALNAASIAKALGKPTPVIAPIGLTFRNPTGWFTDVYIDFAKPLEIPVLEDDSHGEKLLNGWVEPNEEVTCALRDSLRDRLAPLTPDAPNWETWRAWLLLGHLRAKGEGKTLDDWGEEVVAARKVRTDLRGSSTGAWHGPDGLGEEDPAATAEVTQRALPIAAKIHEKRLDGRALVGHRVSRLMPNLAKLVLTIPLMLLFAPFALLANGPQWLIGSLISRFNGEAIDKKTTYQSLPSSLGVIYIRPISFFLAAGLFTYVLSDRTPEIPFVLLFLALAVGVLVISHLSLIITRRWYSLLLDVKYALRTRKLRKSDDWVWIKSEAEEMIEMLGALK